MQMQIKYQHNPMSLSTTYTLEATFTTNVAVNLSDHMLMEDGPLNVLEGAIPGFTGMHAPCPACMAANYSTWWTDPDRSLWEVITHLNDGHKWSREKIADWLETLDVDLTIRQDQNAS